MKRQPPTSRPSARTRLTPSNAFAALAVLAVAASFAGADSRPFATAPLRLDDAADDSPAAGRAWPSFDRPDNWTVQVIPRLWYVSPSGKIRLPSSTTPGGRIQVQDLNIDTPLSSPMGETAIQFGDWRVTFSGFNYNIDRGASAATAFRLGDVSVNPGDAYNTSFDFTSFQGQLGYRIWEMDFGAEGGDAPNRTVLRLDLVAGGRYYDVDIAFTSGATTSQAQKTFGELFGGAHAELQIVRDFSIDVDLTGGGYGDSSNSVVSLDVALAFSWRPVDGVGVQIGWRQLAYDLTSGDGAGEFEYQGRLAGLFAGLVLRF